MKDMKDKWGRLGTRYQTTAKDDVLDRITRLRGIGGQILIHVILAIGGVIVLFPFFWMLSTSLKPLSEIYSKSIQLLPQSPTLEHYLRVLELSPFARYLFNSAFVALAILIGQVLTIVPAAYAFAKRDFPGKQFFFFPC